MNDIPQNSKESSLSSAMYTEQAENSLSRYSCASNVNEHCITCSDEIIAVTVLAVDYKVGIARVTVQDGEEEVDITLIEHIFPGAVVLVHGGVAIGVEDRGEHAEVIL